MRLSCLFTALLFSSFGASANAMEQEMGSPRRNLQGPALNNYTSGFWRSDFLDESQGPGVLVQAKVLAIGVCYAAANISSLPNPSPVPTLTPTATVSGLTAIPSAVPSAVASSTTSYPVPLKVDIGL